MGSDMNGEKEGEAGGREKESEGEKMWETSVHMYNVS